MPEVIEVRKYAKFLKKYMLNKNIKDIIIHKGRYKKYGKPEGLKLLEKDYPIKVIDIKTKGKLLYIEFNNGLYLYSTLGLTGGWTYYDNKTKKYIFPKMIDYITKNKIEQYKRIALNNLNIEFVLVGGKIFYHDNLSFGTMKIIDKNILNKKLNDIAPDIMETSTTFTVFKKQIEKSKYKDKMIGLVIMDQKCISGIGNYLRSDILWCSRISPFRKVKDLTLLELKRIFKNSKLLTVGDFNYKKAIRNGIITEKNRLPRHYERNFFVYFQKQDIYENTIVKELLYTGKIKRFIYWVPSLQK